MKQLLFALLRTALTGAVPAENMLQSCTPERLEAVCRLARSHDMCHMIGQASSKLRLPESESVKQTTMQAFARYMRQNYEYGRVCGLFEEEKIPFIPLKGSVLRAFYPEPWMRTSCDTDILVHPEDVERASALLTERLAYRPGSNSAHDRGFFSPGGENLELHYSLIEDFVSPVSERILHDVWKVAVPVPGKTWQHQLPDAYFYYYHMAHAQKHLVHGGCGIRPVMDTWILNRLPDADRRRRENLLKKGGLLAFARGLEKLSRIWFDAEQMDTMSEQLQQFILTGGSFGSLKNRVTISGARRGGRLRFALSRIFLPYEVMKYEYPVLQKYKLLLPVCQVRRWFRLLFKGGVKRSVRELQITAAVSVDEQASAALLLQYLGID